MAVVLWPLVGLYSLHHWVLGLYGQWIQAGGLSSKGDDFYGKTRNRGRDEAEVFFRTHIEKGLHLLGDQLTETDTEALRGPNRHRSLDKVTGLVERYVQVLQKSFHNELTNDTNTSAERGRVVC